MDEMKRNGSGYYDPTPYEAYKGLKAEKKARKYLGKKVIKTIYNVVHLAGFTVLSISIQDNETGDEYNG